MPRQKITISTRKRPTPTQVKALFVHAPWASRRKPSDIFTMLKASKVLATAWDEKVLVGMARAFSDGVFRGVLWDVIVDSKHHGQGTGSRLVKEVLKQPTMKKLEQIWLFTRNPSFYKTLGFENCGKGVMIKRRK